MKKLIFSRIAAIAVISLNLHLIPIMLNAQVPNAISYQATLRDLSGELIVAFSGIFTKGKARVLSVEVEYGSEWVGLGYTTNDGSVFYTIDDTSVGLYCPHNAAFKNANYRIVMMARE